MKTEKYEKRKIRVYAPTHIYLDIYFFEGKVTEVANKINNFISEHKEFIKNLKEDRSFKKDPMWELINDYEFNIDRWGEDIEFEVRFYRDETDEELNDRIETDKRRSEVAKKRAKMEKTKKEKEERELYEKLKKKYEKPNSKTLIRK